jgi:carboxyl-terminal processing protease
MDTLSFRNHSGLISAESINSKFMSSRSKHLIHRALLLPVLLSTLSLGLRADDATSLPPAPGKVLPATGGVEELDPAQPASKGKVPSPEAQGDAPVQLPVVTPLTFSPERDADIGREVGDLLEQHHYLQKPITPEMSQRWLSNYFLALDPTHLFFLQSDIDEFTAKYGNNLGSLLLHSDSDDAAIAPAFEIFNRYMQRVKEDVTLAEKLVHTNFSYNKDETYTNRTSKSTWIPSVAANAAIWRGQVKSDLLNGVLDKKPTNENVERIAKRYISLLREGTEDDDMDVLESYLSALTHAYDPHSDYFSPEEAQNFSIQAIKHSVTGIGAVLKSDDEGYATIEEVIAGGPADLDKRLQAGDRILAVGQGTDKPVDAVDMKLDHVVDMIRGRKGSMVRLVIAPPGATEAHKIIDIKRDEVSIKASLASAHVIEHRLPKGGIEKVGVIDLHDFYDNPDNHHSAVSDVTALVQSLKKQGVDGIILDMRNNGGGLLDQAVDLTGLFAKQQPVVQIRQSDGAIEQLDPEDTHQIYDGPLVVMVNKMSASATEIVAAALQDYGRAIIVGDPSTHGKGTVQTLIPLDPLMPIGFPSDPGAGNLKMTVQKFYRVAGGSTQQKGVVSDIVLPSVLDALELGETTLPYYLPYDVVPAVPFFNYNLVAPYLAQLRANSAARVDASSDFGYVRQAITFYKKRVQDPTVSLNETIRLKEQADLKALNAQREKDLLARKAGRDTILDLTLDMVSDNSPAAPPEVKKKPESADADSDSDADSDLDADINSPVYDPQLGEAVNIMGDYTRMLHNSGSTLVQAAPVPATK